MNILILEDDPVAFDKIDYLIACGYKVWHAQNLLDVAYYLEYKPGLKFFDKIMLDVSVPIEKFSFFNNAEIEYGRKYKLSGFEFVTENYNFFNKYIQNENIALITAFKVTLFDKIKEGKDRQILEDIRILDKCSEDFMMELLSFLNS